MKTLKIKAIANPVKKEITELHLALNKLNLKVASTEKTSKVIGQSTKDALKEFQRKNNITASGKLNKATLNVLNTELEDAFYTKSKTRTARLHDLFEKLTVNIPKKEKQDRVSGAATRKAIEKLQKDMGMNIDGKINDAFVEKLQEKVIAKKYATKNQIGKLHQTLQRAVSIANIETEIKENELKKKTIGPSTKNTLKAFQEKYNLTPTGKLNKPTLDKLNSVAASRGVPKTYLKKAASTTLTLIKGNLSINKTSPEVANLQKALSHLGYKIATKEFNTKTFGKTTHKAVLKFQKAYHLPQTGKVSSAVSHLLNSKIKVINPSVTDIHDKYRIKGSVRDELHKRKPNMVLHIYEKLLTGESKTPLMTKKNHSNGFFDIVYDAPIDMITGHPKSKFHLLIKLLNEKDELVMTKVLYNVSKTQWVNFNLAEVKYQGDSKFHKIQKALRFILEGKEILEISETENDLQVTQLSVQTGYTIDELMSFILAHHVARGISTDTSLTPETYYAFIQQNLPVDLPGDLLRATNEWETLPQLIELIRNGIVFTDKDTLSDAVDNAITQNLVTLQVKQDKDNILNELSDLQTAYALEKPILIGNANLKMLLDESEVKEQSYLPIAKLFVEHQGVNDSFWEALDSGSLLNKKQYKSLETVINLGNICKNHVPMVHFLSSKIGPGNQKPFNRVSDVAKLDEAEFKTLIAQNDNMVPDNMPGETTEEKAATYARVLQSRSETLFPMVALVAAVKKGNASTMQQISAIEKFTDKHATVDFKEENIDTYLLENQLTLGKETLNEFKAFIRINKLSKKSLAGKILIEQGLHSSARIYAMSKNSLINLFEKHGGLATDALNVYEQAKSQYAYIIGKLMDYAPQIHLGNPRAIIEQTYTKQEIQAVLGDIPNLEALFGSLDYCECEHCKSLYGPAAYLTDILRFLKSHYSLIEQGGSTLTVKEVLFDRRPDIGNIKLNCENTNTPMPYIDLVCELLESHIAPKQEDYDFQTTLSAKELRAIPQHIRPHAYNTLATANYPIDISFNLWQEESRTYLNYLRVPRHELMKAYQDISETTNKKPNNIEIAAEYFQISSHETSIITSQNDDTVAQQDMYWGIDTNQNTVAVSDFMKRTKLSYKEVLDLLLVRFVNDPSTSKSVVQRVPDSCDLDTQQITNMEVAKFDLMHRFIRLWRKTNWTMWELDLLLRNSKIGGSTLDANALINLMKFAKLQEGLKLQFEILLAFYGPINSEERVNPLRPESNIATLYDQLFKNRAITNPLDSKFESLPLDESIVLGENTTGPHAGYSPVSTILSALAVSQRDFELLKTKTDDKLSLDSLSSLIRYAYLAKGLKMSVTELWTFLSLTDKEPFDSLQDTLDHLEYFKTIKSSGFSIQELEYILNYNPDSPLGLRDETIRQYIETLRNTIAINKKTVDSLQLDETNSNTILDLDTEELTTATDNQVLVKIQPLRDLLTKLEVVFTNANFSIEETAYILQFKSDQDRNNLISNIKILQDNVVKVLEKNQKQLTSQVSGIFGFTDEQTKALISRITLSGTAKTLSTVLLDTALLQKDTDDKYVTISSTNFPEHFKVFALLHKIAVLMKQIPIKVGDLDWILVHHATLNTLDISSLPIQPSSSNNFDAWLALYYLMHFKSQYPEPENVSLGTLLSLAVDMNQTKAQILQAISDFTQWDLNMITHLDEGLNLKHESGNLDYADYKTYLRLQKCMEQAKLTGVEIQTMFRWADRISVDQSEVALKTRLSIKSKYENDEWLRKITPLTDAIREKKRNALVSYHLEESQRTQATTVVFDGETIPNPLYWKDANAIYKYLLIDVEMSACQLTSRIKQAISSVQLFVQRCFLNLENRYVQVSQEQKEDVSSENAWSQWKWMKTYRIWEANRKVFFYPENWIEPELRDNKSPFFEELENELLQNEITHDNAESAYLSYLHKVDEVAHLDVCGIYQEQENLNPDEIGYEINNLHVVARTKAMPPVYYYRKYDCNYTTWSAWEKVDIDIESDQLVPVVYNRKLHLFWLVFKEKAQKTKKTPPATASSGPQDPPEPQKMLEIQLAWAIRNNKGWGAKKISKEKMIHPWERPRHAYNLKPFYKPVRNELWLDIYLSTTKEFNNTMFYDPIKMYHNYATRNRFNETYKPWHSSSFIFNGQVKELNLRGLISSYHNYSDGRWSDVPQPGSSYGYVHDNFGEDGAKIKRLWPIEDGPRLRLPYGMHFHNTHLTNNKEHAPNSRYLRILKSNGGSTTLLNWARDPFELVISLQDTQFNSEIGMFYQDADRAFFVKPKWQNRFDQYGRLISSMKKYRFLPFYHPYSSLFIRELNKDGLDGLLNRKIQVTPQNFEPRNTFSFSSNYNPVTAVTEVDNEAKHDRLDFSLGGAFSIYNWELFFHGPLLIANKLMQNQRFEEAMRWFHYIFDPTNIEALPTPQRYWVTKPFYEYNSDDYRKQRIENIISNINDDEHQLLLSAWRNNPFKPHLIARYRPVAYQRNVVMKYLDNLIAWGDQLFRRDSIESINEASLLYMLAYEILGDRPEKVPNVNREDLSFNEIEDKLDEFGNATVDTLIEDTLVPIDVVPSSEGDEPMPTIDTFYFCIPHNSDLLSYWDTVEDRLFKIRHCMNIEGVVRQLPLFQPPIDPALLVKAAASGIDLSSVLNDITAGTPHYRFRVVVQKAVEFTSRVQQLGEKLLSVLEKRDAEALSLLRVQHEIQLQEAVREVRKKQVDEAVEILGSMQKSQVSAQERHNYYTDRDLMNSLEIASMALSSNSVVATGVTGIFNLLAGYMHLIPTFSFGIAGFGGTPNVSMSTGGSTYASSIQAYGSAVQNLGTMLSQIASMLNTVASYQRRKEEWDFQGRLASIDIEQTQFQINAAEIRQSIAELELENQELKIENSKSEEEYMRSKYTNEQLYNWMITQVSTIYFQGYQLAYDMAKKAEQCYRYELGIDSSSFIEFGYWDSLKKGLLSGDKLLHDIQRMESSYFDMNKRELEITKHISLAKVAPLSLVTLKETGSCSLALPEWLFNMDYPGHYMRRIKTVSVSIPFVAGPYTSVNCSLVMTKNETRLDATLSGGTVYGRTDENDLRFKTQLGAISSIATSHGQADSGMFELNFNDERYLPFEGAGAISEWQINMPLENNQFDFASISDIIIHISYTARDGGVSLALAANTELQDLLPDNSVKLFNIKQDFPNEWHKFLYPNNGQDQEFVVELKPEHYPFMLKGSIKNLKIKKLDIFMESDTDTDLELLMKVTSLDYETSPTDVTQDPVYNNVHYTIRDYESGEKPKALGTMRFKLKVKGNPDNFISLDPNQIKEMFLLCHLEQ